VKYTSILLIFLLLSLIGAGIYSYLKKEEALNREYDPDVSSFPKWERVVGLNESLEYFKVKTFDIDIIKQINKQYNDEYTYISDGLNDVWLSPDEFFDVKEGDCEDFAIAKYYELLHQGIAPEDMEIVIVAIKSDGTIHAVLRVFGYKDKAYTLDIIAPKFKTAAQHMKVYEDIYAINHLGWRRC